MECNKLSSNGHKCTTHHGERTCVIKNAIMFHWQHLFTRRHICHWSPTPVDDQFLHNVSQRVQQCIAHTPRCYNSDKPGKQTKNTSMQVLLYIISGNSKLHKLCYCHNIWCNHMYTHKDKKTSELSLLQTEMGNKYWAFCCVQVFDKLAMNVLSTVTGSYPLHRAALY